MQSYCHNGILAGMAKTLGPVALKLGDEVLVKVRTNTALEALLEQLEKACKGGRIQARLRQHQVQLSNSSTTPVITPPVAWGQPFHI